MVWRLLQTCDLWVGGDHKWLRTVGVKINNFQVGIKQLFVIEIPKMIF